MISLNGKSCFCKDCNLKINYSIVLSGPNVFECRACSYAVTVYQKIFTKIIANDGALC